MAIQIYKSVFSRIWPSLRRNWPIVLIAAMVLIFFWDSFLAGKILYLRDAICDFVPNFTFSRQAIRQGAIPLWNHYSQCGRAFVAEPQTEFFYPLNALFYLLPVTLALKLSLGLHQFIAATTCYGLMRHWKLGRAAALVSALAYAFSTQLIASMEFLSKFNTLCWMPLSLMLLSKYIEEWMEKAAVITAGARFRSGLLTVISIGIVLAVQFLAGHSQTFMFTLILLGMYALLRPLAEGDFRAAFASCIALGMAGLLAIGLVMPQLLLTLELVNNSIRSGGIDPRMDMASLHPRLLFGWLLPFFGGRPGYCHTWWGMSDNPQTDLGIFEFWAGTAYIGIAPLILSLTALLSIAAGERYNSSDKKMRFLTIFFAVSALAGLVIAMGKYTPVCQFVYNYVPGFNRFRWPSQSLVIVVFATSVLAGLGLHAVLDFYKSAKPRFNRYKAFWWMWLILLLVMGAGYFYVRHRPGFFTMLTGGAFVSNPVEPKQFEGLMLDYGLGILFLALSVTALAPIFLGRRRFGVVIACVGLIAATYLNLFIIGRQINFIAADDIYAETPRKILDKVGPDQLDRTMTFYKGGQQLIYGSRDEELYRFVKATAIGETWLPYHVFRANGESPLSIKNYTLFSQQLQSWDVDNNHWQQFANLMNVRYIINVSDVGSIICGLVSPSYYLVENSACLPRALLVEDWEIGFDDNAPWSELLSPSFDPHKSAIVDKLPKSWGAAKTGSVPDSVSDDSGVDSIAYDWNRVDLKVRAERPSLLVLNDIWYPGWKAFVDGQTQPIVRTNYLFRGVFIQPGRHNVLFVYDPWQLKAGAACSAGTLLIICILAYIKYWRFKGN